MNQKQSQNQNETRDQNERKLERADRVLSPRLKTNVRGGPTIHNEP